MIEPNQEMPAQEFSTALTGFRLSLIAAAAFVLSPIGYRLHWWDITVALKYLVGGGIAIAAVALVVSLMAVIKNRSHKRVFLFALSGIMISIASAGLPVSQLIKYLRAPHIHDLTTDLSNPPRFVALAHIRKKSPNGAEYEGVKVASLQKQAYPDIASYQSSLTPAQLFGKAAGIIHNNGWEIATLNLNEGRIEATDTTLIYGFKDDVVIRILSSPQGSRLDIRSASRVGSNDFGANAARIRKFVFQLQVDGA